MSNEEQIEKRPAFIPIVTRNDFTLKDVTILNGIVSCADIEIIGHYGNVVSLKLGLDMSNGMRGFFMPYYNHTKHIGFIVKALDETLLEPHDDNVAFSALEDTPCRVIEVGNKIVGIGNFMKDRWLLEDEVTKWIKGDEDGED